MVDPVTYVNAAVLVLMVYVPKLVLAVIVLLVGLKVIGMFGRSLTQSMEKREVDASLRPFLSSLATTLVKVLLVISVASMIGIEMTSFVAVIAAAGLAVGLALQGSLANFAGGVLLLIFKPIHVGDVVEAQGIAGKVQEIQIFATAITTFDNKTVVIPNGVLSNGVITNYSTQPTRRVDLVFGISYDDDFSKAKEILAGLARKDERVLGDPAPNIRVSELADSSVNLIYRVWVNSDDYWDVYFDAVEGAKKAFDDAGISIPYPQMDIHMSKE